MTYKVSHVVIVDNRITSHTNAKLVSTANAPVTSAAIGRRHEVTLSTKTVYASASWRRYEYKDWPTKKNCFCHWWLTLAEFLLQFKSAVNWSKQSVVARQVSPVRAQSSLRIRERQTGLNGKCATRNSRMLTAYLSVSKRFLGSLLWFATNIFNMKFMW